MIREINDALFSNKFQFFGRTHGIKELLKTQVACVISEDKNCTDVNRQHHLATYVLDTVQDFLIKLGIKPRMHLLEIGIFSLYHVIVRPTKIMNRADKNWAHFQKTKYFKNQSFQKISFLKVDLLVKYSSQKKEFRKIQLIFDAEK